MFSYFEWETPHVVPLSDQARGAFSSSSASRARAHTRPPEYRILTNAALRTIHTIEEEERVHPDSVDDGFPAYWFTYRPRALELEIRPSMFTDRVHREHLEQYGAGSFSSTDALYDLLDFTGEWR